MINDDNKKSIKSMLKSNALYFALGLCLLGAATVGFSAMGNNEPKVTPEATTSREETIIVREPKTENGSENNMVEIKIDEFTTLPEEEPSTAAVFDNNASKVNEEEVAEEKKVFSAPLSQGIGTDFSMGIPVFSQTMNDYRTHNGVDFKGVKGESVNTVASGKVISVEKNAVWGNTVTIDHGNGTVSKISGLADEALISAGCDVNEGTVIGVVGEIPDDSKDDSHVHLEIRVNGELVDPLEILGLAGE